MEQNLTDYFRSIGMGTAFIERISTIHDQLIIILNDPPQDVVVNEYVTNDGQRQYGKVFFFSEVYVYEVENMMSESFSIWIAKLTGNIGCFELTQKDYDFRDAKPASRLKLQCIWQQGTGFELEINTSGENCSHLLNIVTKYVKPNLV